VIVKLADRTAHVDGKPNLEGVELLRKFPPEQKALAGRVCLDDELDTSNVVIGRMGVYRRITISQFTTPERKMCFPVGRPRT
jgi:hypothetical protein